MQKETNKFVDSTVFEGMTSIRAIIKSYDAGINDNAELTQVADEKGIELQDWGIDPAGFETPQGQVKSVGELDVDSFEEEQTLKLKFKPEQYSFVLAKLREYGDDFSASLLLILGYKPEDYE